MTSKLGKRKMMEGQKSSAPGVTRIKMNAPIVVRGREVKYHTTAGGKSYDGDETEFNYLNLNVIAQGAATDERVGAKIYPKKLRATMEMQHAPGVTGNGRYVRVWVLCDNQTNGAAPATEDWLLIPSGTPSAGGLYNPQGSKRFDILYDKTFSLNCEGTGSGTGADRKFVKKTAVTIDVPLKKTVEYAKGTDDGSITTQKTCSYYLVYFIDGDNYRGSDIDNHVHIWWNAMLFYTDA